MAENQSYEQEATHQREPEDAWREVGRQFEALGESLSRAVRAAWESEETQQYVSSMQEGLEKMAGEIDRTVQEAGESEQAKRLRAEAQKTATSLRQAGEQTWQEARPQLLIALRKANAELRRLIENLEQKQSTEGPTSDRSSSGAGASSTTPAEEA
jgi:dsDNA-specific endonuclease/ATPase MutS2